MFQTKKAKRLKKLNLLIEKCEKILSTKYCDELLLIDVVDGTLFYPWKKEVLVFLNNELAPENKYYQEFYQQPNFELYSNAQQSLSILKKIKEDPNAWKVKKDVKKSEINILPLNISILGGFKINLSETIKNFFIWIKSLYK